jgi:hypothetical protein
VVLYGCETRSQTLREEHLKGSEDGVYHSELYCVSVLLPSSGILNTRTVVPNLWYSYPWGYVVDRLEVGENNISNGGKHKQKELKQKHKNKVMKFRFTNRD